MFQSSRQSALVKWHSVQRVLPTHSALVFELNTSQALLAPRRSFPTPAASQKFATLAEELRVSAGSPDTDLPSEAELETVLGSNRVGIHYEIGMRELAWRVRHAHIRRLVRDLWMVVISLLSAVVIFGIITGSVVGFLFILVGMMLTTITRLFAFDPWLETRKMAGLSGVLGLQHLWVSDRGTVTRASDDITIRSAWRTYSAVRRVGDYLVLERDGLPDTAIPLRAMDEATAFKIKDWHANAYVTHPYQEVGG